MREGRLVDAVAQIAKSGYVWVFERATGKPLFPIEYRKVPHSDVEGEALAETQPFPLGPAPFARQRLTEEMLTKRTPEGNRIAREQFRKGRSDGEFTPPSHEGSIVFPGFDGGAEWGGSAFDPETGLLYVNSNEMAFILKIVERPKAQGRASGRTLYLQNCAACHRDDFRGTPPTFPSLVGIAEKYSANEVFALSREGSGRMPGFANLGDPSIWAIASYLTSGRDTEVEAKAETPSPFEMAYTFDGYNKFLDPDGYPAIEPPWGTLNAINLDTGEMAWKIPLGEIPALVAQGVRNSGSENYGGPLVTAGGVLFIGATCFDQKFHAYDKRTGKLLWETTLPASGTATPATYEVNGRQFVVIAAGGGKWGAPSGGTYVAFALPKKR
jgi:quinoprotein glucose dehydrogenase